MKNKKSIFTKLFAICAAVAVLATFFAGCGKKGASRVDYSKYDSGVVKALNAVAPSVSGDVLSQTATINGDKYLVTVITDESVNEYVVGEDLTVEGSRDVIADESSSAGAPDTSESASEQTPSVSDTSESAGEQTPSVSESSESAGEQTPSVSESESEQTPSVSDSSSEVGSESQPENPEQPTDPNPPVEEPAEPKTDLERAYDEAVKLAAIDKAEITAFDFDRSRFMGIDAYEIELKTVDGKYSFVLKADDLTVLSSSIKLAGGKQDAVDETSYIGETVAKGIALNAAGAEETAVSNLKITVNRSNGNRVYKVRFDYASYHYDATIDAVSGKVVKFVKEILASEVLSSAVTTAVTVDEAKNIALAFVFPEATSYEGLEYTFKKVKLDYDDGAFVYEIEIIVGGMEYEIEVSAETAEIVDAEIDDDDYDDHDDHDDHDDDDDDDDDDDHGKLGEGYITEEEAINAVLTVAGEGAIVTDIEVEKEGVGANKTFYYEIEVKVGGKKHEYLVNATTGEVTEKGGDRDEPEAIVTEKQALKIALEHYSVAESEAKVHKIKLHTDDDGEPEYYEVKFSVKNLNYTVVIDAETARIIRSDKLFD